MGAGCKLAYKHWQMVMDVHPDNLTTAFGLRHSALMYYFERDIYVSFDKQSIKTNVHC